MGFRLSAAAFAALLAAVPLSAAPVHKPAAHRGSQTATRDWSRTVVATPEGGYRMGNPAAAVKVVEYGSLTCPHCRLFAQTGYQPLVQRYVRTGTVSYEFRNLILNGIDVSATLLARCAGNRFFGAAEAMYATQPQWIGRVSAITAAQKAQLQSLPDDQRLLRIAHTAGLTQMVARFGVTPQRAAQCLSSKPGLARLASMAAAANKIGVDQTPTFFINGTKTDAATWEQLEPLIRKSGG